jgi:phage shock protein E
LIAARGNSFNFTIITNTMKKLLLLFAVLSIYSCKPSDSTSKELMAPVEFADELKSNPEIILLDVRTPSEVEAGFIDGATNMDYNSEGFAKAIDSLDRSKTYFVYCAAGKRSGKALDLMKEKGFQKVTSLEGGLKAWSADGLPVQMPK